MPETHAAIDPSVLCVGSAERHEIGHPLQQVAVDRPAIQVRRCRSYSPRSHGPDRLLENGISVAYLVRVAENLVGTFDPGVRGYPSRLPANSNPNVARDALLP
jgi:hypothetical protein